MLSGAKIVKGERNANGKTAVLHTLCAGVSRPVLAQRLDTPAHNVQDGSRVDGIAEPPPILYASAYKDGEIRAEMPECLDTVQHIVMADGSRVI